MVVGSKGDGRFWHVSPKAREREFRSLRGITGDNYPRLVLSLDEMDFSDSAFAISRSSTGVSVVE